jgi:hypothetical protein
MPAPSVRDKKYQHDNCVNNQFYMKQMKKKVHVPFPALTAGFL